MTLRYIELVNEVSGALPLLPIAELGPPVLRPLRGPLDSARVIIVTSAGVHHADDPPFAPTNDLSFRRLEQQLDPSTLRVSHPSPIHGPGCEDIDVVYPYQRLAELASEGVIGRVTHYHLSILGAIKQLRTLVTELAPAMAADARSAGADLALLVPL